MTLRVYAVGSADAERIRDLQLMDAVFIEPQKRWPSMERRYPCLAAPGSSTWIFSHWESGAPLAALAVKVRAWSESGVRRQLGMVGGVCTRPEARGRGLASSLLRAVEDRRTELKVDALVLWTGIHGFYERLGYRTEDAGLLGTVAGWPAQHSGVSAARPVNPVENGRLLEIIREVWTPDRIQRAPEDYGAVPLPAEKVEAWVAGEGSDAAYVLAGLRGDAAYVYEAAGNPGTWSAAWSALSRRCPRIYVNASEGSLTKNWLDAHGRVEWVQKPLSMWKGEPRPYVPYFDRI